MRQVAALPGEVAAGDDNFNETGLPIVKEPVELTFLYVKGANTMDFKDNAMFQQMEKDTNVKINWQYAGDADWSGRVALAGQRRFCPTYSSGDNALKDNDIATNLDMFIPLEDYVEKYCPNIKAAWEAEPTMRQMIKSDGHIYTLPGKKPPLRPEGLRYAPYQQGMAGSFGPENPHHRGRVVRSAEGL